VTVERLAASCALALVACACRSNSIPPPQAKPAALGTAGASGSVTVAVDAGDAAEGVFSRGGVLVTKGAPPARFAAALPVRDSDFDDADRLPPLPFVQSRFRSGNVEMQERWLRGLRLVTQHGPLTEDLRGYYAEIVGPFPSRPACSFLAAVAKGTEAAPVKALAWDLSVACAAPEFAAVLDDPAAPDEVVVGWYEKRYGDELYTLTPRLERAVAAVAHRGKTEDLESAGMALGRTRGPRMIPLARAILAKLPNDEARAHFGVGFGRRKEPDARAIGQRACAHASMRRHYLCTKDQPERPGPIDIADATAKLPRAQALKALDRCVRDDGQPYQRRLCLERLATLDRPSAVRTSNEASLPKSDDYGLVELANALRKFPKAEDLERHLRGLGFTARSQGRVLDDALDYFESKGHDTVLTSADVLVKDGRLHWFDVETGMFPNEHDALLFELAEIAAPVLDDALFEEIPPDEESDKAYVLRAYLDGRCYEIAAENFGDWYDVDAVLKLLQALLEARRSPVRFESLATGDQTARVIAGPKRAIATLAADGLLITGAAAVAMRVGKEFEEEVIQRITDGGVP
jgi:hypothetical protein